MSKEPRSVKEAREILQKVAERERIVQSCGCCYRDTQLGEAARRWIEQYKHPERKKRGTKA